MKIDTNILVNLNLSILIGKQILIMSIIVAEKGLSCRLVLIEPIKMVLVYYICQYELSVWLL